jgi:hypothetical protein
MKLIQLGRVTRETKILFPNQAGGDGRIATLVKEHRTNGSKLPITGNVCNNVSAESVPNYKVEVNPCG